MDAVADGSISIGPVDLGMDYADGVHFATNTEVVTVAKYSWIAIENAAFSGSYGRGPRISTNVIDSTKKIVTVTYDQLLSNTDGALLPGVFQVNDSGTPVTISSAVVAGGTRVVIHLAAAIVGTPTDDFAFGDSVEGLAIPLSVLKTLPDSSTTNLPAEPFLAQSVASEGGGGPGSVTIARGDMGFIE
jgi:hypothetical protein